MPNDVIGGLVCVRINDRDEVELIMEKNKAALSVRQARALAVLLIKKADEAAQEKMF